VGLDKEGEGRRVERHKETVMSTLIESGQLLWMEQQNQKGVSLSLVFLLHITI
jgi:hypothetical protein